jgi:hypothetical protein
MRNFLSTLLVCLTLGIAMYGKDALPPVSWPTDKPVLQFTISKVNHVGGYQGQQAYILDLAVTNLSAKRIPQASFTFYLFDKQQVRVGKAISIWQMSLRMRR